MTTKRKGTRRPPRRLGHPRRQGWIGGVTLGLLLGTMVYAVAEDISLTTYYPSPRGVYQNLQVRASFFYTDGNQGAGKVLVSDAAGNATWADPNDPLLPPLVPSGMVAIFPGGCPAGWSGYGAADGWYLKAGSSHGSTGGRPNHAHEIDPTNLSHVHWSDPGADDTSLGGQHTHDVNISHDHSYSGTTGDSGCSSNRMGDCDNDACIIPDTSHCHGYGGTTSNEGGDRTTTDVPSHHHVVDLPGWNVNTSVAWPPVIWTDAEDLDPEYFTVRLCIKN